MVGALARIFCEFGRPCYYITARVFGARTRDERRETRDESREREGEAERSALNLLAVHWPSSRGSRATMPPSPRYDTYYAYVFLPVSPRRARISLSVATPRDSLRSTTLSSVPLFFEAARSTDLFDLVNLLLYAQKCLNPQ